MIVDMMVTTDVLGEGPSEPEIASQPSGQSSEEMYVDTLKQLATGNCAVTQARHPIPARTSVSRLAGDGVMTFGVGSGMDPGNFQHCV